MNFSKENIKQIRSLIAFTLLLLIGLWKYEVVLDILGFVWGIISPFILGGAIEMCIRDRAWQIVRCLIWKEFGIL